MTSGERDDQVSGRRVGRSRRRRRTRGGVPAGQPAAGDGVVVAVGGAAAVGCSSGGPAAAAQAESRSLSVADLPRCAVSELPRVLCDHCDSFTMSAAEIAYLAGELGAAKRRRTTRRTFPVLTDRPGRWAGLVEATKKPLIVNCTELAVGLCPRCLEQLGRVLADVPRLFDDLDVAIAGEARFGHRGSTVAGSDDGEDQDGKGPTRGNPLILAQARLREALELAHDWFDARDPGRLADELAAFLPQLADEPAMRRIAREVSSAASRAHKAIDAPPELQYFGPCPDCGRDIWQKRVRKDDDDTTPIVCVFCGYGATLGRHHQRMLEGIDDRWLTVSEIVEVMAMLDEPVTRDQVYRWLNHEGLPREKLRNPKRRYGEIVGWSEIEIVRVGDVRDKRLEMLVRRGRKPATRA